MKRIKSTFSITLAFLFMSASVFAMEHVTEKPAEELHNQELQKQQLEQKQKENQLEQERLKEQYTHETTQQKKTELSQDIKNLENEHANTQKAIDSVDARIVVLDNQISGGSTVPIEPTKEKPVAASIREWEKGWKKLAGEPWLLSYGGTLFQLTTSVAERVSQITQAIDSLPNETYKNFSNSSAGLDTLERISSTIESLVSKNLLARDTNYDTLRKTLQAKGMDLVSRGDFGVAITQSPLGPVEPYVTTGSESEQINGLADIYDRIASLSYGDAEFANNLENLVVNRMKTEIQNAPAKELTSIKDNLLSRASGRFTGKKYLELRNALTVLVGREQINRLYNDAESGKGTLPTLAKQLLIDIDPQFKKLASAAIVDQFNKDINVELANVSHDKALETKTIQDEYDKLKNLDLDPTSKAQLKTVFDKGLANIAAGKTQEDVGRLQDLKVQTSDLVKELSELSSFENATELNDKIDALSKEIEAFSGTSSLSDNASKEIFNSLRELQAWQDVVSLASSYQTAITKGSTLEQVQETFQTLQTSLSDVLNQLDYRATDDFASRLQIMQRQSGALAKTQSLLSESPITVNGKKYTLSQASKILSDFFEKDLMPSAAEWNALKESGLVASQTRNVEVETSSGVFQQQPRAMDVVTDKGQTFIEMGKIYDVINRRTMQLDTFTKAYAAGNGPSLNVPNSSGREIKLATELKLSWMIPDDEISTLKDVYRSYYVGGTFNQAMNDFYEGSKADTQTEKQAFIQKTKNLQEMATNKALFLTDIGDYLQVIRDLSKKVKPEFQASDPYFEALVIEQRKLEDPNVTPAQKQAFQENLKGTMLKILAYSDSEATLQIQAPGLLQETKTLFKEMGNIFAEGYNAFALTISSWKVSIQQKAARALWWSVLPASVVTFFGVEVGIRYGAPMVAGTVVPIVGGIAVGALANTVATDIIALGSAIATGAGIGYAAYKTEGLSRQNLQSLNDRMVAARYEPEQVVKKGMLTSIKDKAVRFFYGDTSTRLAKAEDYTLVLNQKQKFFDQARAQFLDLLGLKPNASLVDVQNALKVKQAELDQGLAINRWLISRKINNAYDFMIATGKTMIDAHRYYNIILVDVAVKEIANIAQANASTFKSIVAKGTNGITKLTNFFRGLETKKLTPEEFQAVANDLIQDYAGNVLDLREFKDLLDKNSDRISKSTLFQDTTFTDQAKLLIDNQVQLTSQSFQKNIDELLQGFGYPSVVVQRQTTPPPGK